MEMIRKRKILTEQQTELSVVVPMPLNRQEEMGSSHGWRGRGGRERAQHTPEEGRGEGGQSKEEVQRNTFSYSLKCMLQKWATDFPNHVFIFSGLEKHFFLYQRRSSQTSMQEGKNWKKSFPSCAWAFTWACPPWQSATMRSSADATTRRPPPTWSSSISSWLCWVKKGSSWFQ